MAHLRHVWAALLAFSLASHAEGSTTAASDFADPFVTHDGDAYIAFATGTGGRNIQTMRSRDLTSWAAPSDALPVLPAWAARDGAFTWAPSTLRRDHGWVLYYTTRDARSGFQCISRATSDKAAGPYTDDSPAPLVCQTDLCGSIDPSPFVDAQGSAWLVWKSDENSVACRGAARIWSQALSPDGLGVSGAPATLLTTDRDWERPLIEGPSMVRNGEDLYLFYSANWYESPDYAIGYAKCARPTGPCTKVTVDGPLMKSALGTVGPGGQEVFTDVTGRTWLAFHAWPGQASYATGGVRSLRLAPLTFSAGTPVIGR